MKKIKLAFSLLVIALLGSYQATAQTPTCSELYSYVKKEGGYPSTQSCYGSSFLVKAERYVVNGTGVAIIWMKANEYDFSGTPYMYCGISSYTWSSFTSAGMTGSWGKAFHK